MRDIVRRAVQRFSDGKTVCRGCGALNDEGDECCGSCGVKLNLETSSPEDGLL